MVQKSGRRPAGDADRPSFSSYLGGTGCRSGKTLEKSACQDNLRTVRTWLTYCDYKAFDRKPKNDSRRPSSGPRSAPLLDRLDGALERLLQAPFADRVEDESQDVAFQRLAVPDHYVVDFGLAVGQAFEGVRVT